MYYTVIKHSGHLRTLEKCREHLPAARVFYISLVPSNARRVLSQSDTGLRFLYLLNKKMKRCCKRYTASVHELFSRFANFHEAVVSTWRHKQIITQKTV